VTTASLTLRLARLQDAHPIALMSRELVEFGLAWRYNPDHVRRLIRDPNTLVLLYGDRCIVALLASGVLECPLAGVPECLFLPDREIAERREAVISRASRLPRA
jgi:hypothetical protein